MKIKLLICAVAVGQSLTGQIFSNFCTVSLKCSCLFRLQQVFEKKIFCRIALFF